MSITVRKLSKDTWSVKEGSEQIGIANWSREYGGTYEFELPSGTIIYATNQGALKRLIKENY